MKIWIILSGILYLIIGILNIAPITNEKPTVPKSQYICIWILGFLYWLGYFLLRVMYGG